MTASSPKNGHGVPKDVQAIWMDTDLMGPRADDAPPLSDEFDATAKKLMARYPEGRERSALLPLLYLAQSEQGYVSGRAIKRIAGLLGMRAAEVAAVSSFYTMFKREPQGKWLVSVCTQPSCYLAGGKELKDRLEQELGVTAGATSDDGSVTLEDVECLCACDGAPVFSINYENYEGMSVDAAIEMVKGLRAGGDPPAGARGDVPEPFTAVSRRMSGIEAPMPRTRGDR